MRIRIAILKPILFAGILLVSNIFAQTDGQKVPRLNRAFVFNNGGVKHWHESVAQGAEIVRAFASGQNPYGKPFEIFETENASDFTAVNLEGVDVIVFNNTTGLGLHALTAAQKAVVETFVKAGGGIAGWHGMTDTGGNTQWPWFIDWMSARFDGGAGSNGQLLMRRTEDSKKPEYADIVSHFDPVNEFEMVSDETYTFASPSPENNPDNVILVTVNPNTVKSSKPYMPYVWVNEKGLGPDNPNTGDYGGRQWSAGFGHSANSLNREDVRETIYRGIAWAGGGWDIAGCMIEGDPNYRPEATIACRRNCCEADVSVIISTNGISGAEISQELTVYITSHGNHSVEIYSVMGKLLQSRQNSSPGEYQFGELLEKGIYFVKVKTQEESITDRVVLY